MTPATGDALSIMRDDWNQRAREDANYYVAFISPNQQEDSFYRSAAEIVRELESELHRLDPLGAGIARRRALDIGCGPGRLLLPLSRHFDEIYGVDISDEMIRIARGRLQSVPNAHVLVNSGCDLALFEDNYFSFVYSYIVFQHIPSKEIVFNYLREIQRVLVPGGVTRFQVRGAPPSKAGEEDPITWKGCVIPDSEIVDFARDNEMEIVGLSGEQTQYLWVTLRKRPQPSLEAVTSSSNSLTRVPQRGPGSAISLWIRHAPSSSDLTTLTARVDGQPVRGTYLSPIAREGGCQLNVTLPRNLPLGEVEVVLLHHGDPMTPSQVITVEPAALLPRIIAVSDAVDVAQEMRSVSGGVKVLVEDLEDPRSIAFQIAGQPVEDVDVSSTNRFLNQYLFSFLVPPNTQDGSQTLTAIFNGQVVYQTDLDIRVPHAVKPAVIFDAVTSALGPFTTIPQRGPEAAISLWMRNAPSDADLTTLIPRINGDHVTASYLSPIGPDGGCQMNVLLPRNLPLGTVEVALIHHGEVIDPIRSITIEPKPGVPRVAAVCDADNAALEMRSVSGSLKVLVEDVENPRTIQFQIAGKAVDIAEITCTNEILDQYLFSLRLPRELAEGPQTLVARFGAEVVDRAELIVQWPVIPSKPAAVSW